MTSTVRKLALDIGFPRLVPVQILVALAFDYAFLRHPDFGLGFAAGILLSMQASATYSKIALWRTLPVSRRDIGRARWWQMTGLPGVGIVAMMGAALVLHILTRTMGWDVRPLRADAMAIAGSLLLQFFYPVFVTLLALAITFVRITRSPFAWAATVAVCLPWLLLLPQAVPGLAESTRILALGMIGLTGAIMLYIGAPAWPLPVTLPLQFDIAGGRNGIPISRRAGQRGWPALCAMAVQRSVLCATSVAILYGALLAFIGLDSVLVMQAEFVTVVILLLQVTIFNATALRALRALPGSSVRLAAYMFLLPLALVAAWLCFFSLILVPWLIGDIAIIDVVPLSAALFVGALALPAALAVRQTAMSLIVISSGALMGLAQFGWVHVPPPWHDERLLAALTLLAICGGFYWMHRLISRGARVYRLRPFAPARWRGKD